MDIGEAVEHADPENAIQYKVEMQMAREGRQCRCNRRTETEVGQKPLDLVRLVGKMFAEPPHTDKGHEYKDTYWYEPMGSQ